MISNAKFALIGVGGYIAPRHLRAIKETGNILVAALDKNDSVGIIDSYFPEADFFTEFERFDRHLEKLKRNDKEKIDYLVVCSPNYLHDAHIRFGLRIGANVICEKPIVLNPWNVDALSIIEKETNCKINPILQFRFHPSIMTLKKIVDEHGKNAIFDIDLTYITPRGHWYEVSWKGDEKKSGGIVTNIGIHFFDMLCWIFGEAKNNIVNIYNHNKAAGFLELERARVRWFLSTDKNDLPSSCVDNVYRSITINNKESIGFTDKVDFEFPDNFEELHIQSYKRILSNKGFSLNDIKPSIEIVSAIRNIKPIGKEGEYHPFLNKIEL